MGSYRLRRSTRSFAYPLSTLTIKNFNPKRRTATVTTLEIPDSVDLTPEEELDAFRRKDKAQRKGLIKAYRLKHKAGNAKLEASILKKSFEEASAEVEKLINFDINNFLRWEEEQVPKDTTPLFSEEDGEEENEEEEEV